MGGNHTMTHMLLLLWQIVEFQQLFHQTDILRHIYGFAWFQQVAYISAFITLQQSPAICLLLGDNDDDGSMGSLQFAQHKLQVENTHSRWLC
jgi:hypothetical protein